VQSPSKADLRPRVLSDAARSAALLYFLGAAVIAIEASVVPTPHFPPSYRWVPWGFVGLFALGAAALWRVPDRLPALGWPLVAALPTLAILFMGVASRDATATSQVAFCWPVLFASYHLRPVIARLIALEVVLAEVVLCLRLEPHEVALEDAFGVSLILVAVMFTLVRARDRLDVAITDLRHDAEHDALTGLLGRRAFDAALVDLYGDQQVSLLLIDIDDFKSVNDTFGHAAGDAILRIVADALTAHCRHGDLAYRIGGDEMAVILVGCSAGNAMRRAETIRHAIEASSALAVAAHRGIERPGRGHVTVSLGVASVPEHTPRYTGLLPAADAAMYRAKEAGRNCVMSAASAA
jgi:diguanylate cyclase (GGDEF)-like protein